MHGPAIQCVRLICKQKDIQKQRSLTTSINAKMYNTTIKNDNHDVFCFLKVTEEEVQTMVLASKEVNTMMADSFTFVVTLNPSNGNVPNIVKKMKRHFRHVEILYGCNRSGTKRPTSG